MIEKIYKKNSEVMDKCALIYNEKCISYKSLELHIDNTARLLWDNNLRKDDRIVVILPNCPEIIYAVFGAWKIQATAVLLDFRLSQNEYQVIFEEIKPNLIITNEKVIQKSLGFLNSMDSMATIIDLEKNYLDYDERDLNFEQYKSSMSDCDFDAVIKYTSGTTGKPKGIVRKIKSIENEAEIFSNCMGYTAKDVILVVIPMYHTYAFGDALVSGLYGDSCLVIQEQFSGREQLKAIEKYNVTTFLGVPFMYSAFCELNVSQKYNTSSLRALICAGAALKEEINKDFEKCFGIPIFPLYGSSETATICVNKEVEQNACYNSVGKAIAGVEIIIRDESGNLLTNGDKGDIWVKSCIAGYKYFNQLELTEGTFIAGYINTGDVGFIDNAGMLYITGRKKCFINVNGEKVDPYEVEDVIKRHANVKECVVLGVQNSIGSEIVKAVIVTLDNENIKRSEIISLCTENLAQYKIPSIIEFIDKIPLSPTGKVLRKLLL
jgi:long-chain acyl-CoA synthetase